MKITKVEALKKIANDIRKGVIESVYNGKSGHPGGSLSCADILTVLYFNQMNLDQPELEGEKDEMTVWSLSGAANLTI